MQASRKTWLIRIGSFVLAGLLLYFALRGVDFDVVADALATANYWWLVPMTIAILLSHWLRAVRWRILLNVLPERSERSESVSDLLAFLAIMIGYMANYAGPRVGELVRSGTMAARDKLQFSSVFGTIVVERVLDTATLALGLVTIPLIYGSETGRIREMLIDPTLNFLRDYSTMAWIGLVILAALGLAGAYWLLRPTGEGSDGDADSRLGHILYAFRDGFRTLIRTGRSGAITLLTFGIWALYGLVAWLGFFILDLAEPYGIGFFDGWGIMLLGAIGVVIPSPGGIGSYHYITTESLEILYAMPQTQAATYALLVHTGQMLLYIAVGFAAILWVGNKFGKSSVRSE